MTRYRYFKGMHNHILSPPSGQMPEHRVILFEKIGLGPHRCHWCGCSINWSDRRTAEGALTVDHIDGDTTNNARENLVESCHSCNLRRARDQRFEDQPFIVNTKGHRDLAQEMTCLTCGATFLALVKAVKNNPRKGRYCSRRCLYDRTLL